MPKTGAKVIDRFLPLQPLPSSAGQKSIVNAREEAIHHFYAHASTPIPNEASSEDPLFPGQQHKIYNAPDRNGTLPEEYKRVLQLASRMTGIESLFIERTVYHMEMTFTKKEMGYKSQLTKINQLPSQGIETQMYGKLREKGGSAPWPRDIAPSARLAKPEKENALLMPKMHI